MGRGNSGVYGGDDDAPVVPWIFQKAKMRERKGCLPIAMRWTRHVRRWRWRWDKTHSQALARSPPGRTRCGWLTRLPGGMQVTKGVVLVLQFKVWKARERLEVPSGK